MRISDVGARSSPHILLEQRAVQGLVALVVAVWPVWQWMFGRAVHDTADAWALLSLATAAAILWRDRAQLSSDNASWFLPTCLVVIYIVSYSTAPPLVRAIIAMTAIGSSCSSLWFGKRIDVPLMGLFLLALPLIPSLNFFIGYPLRVMVGEAASGLLQMNGFSVVREGTLLVWGGKQVSVDAPCSGIKMLWTGMYLSCTLAALWRMNTRRTAMLAVAALAIVISANVLRATALFYVEAEILPNAEEAHGPLGMVVFVAAAMSIAWAAARLRAAAHAR